MSGVSRQRWPSEDEPVLASQPPGGAATSFAPGSGFAALNFISASTAEASEARSISRTIVALCGGVRVALLSGKRHHSHDCPRSFSTPSPRA